jgi:hypothetical protein
VEWARLSQPDIQSSKCPEVHDKLVVEYKSRRVSEAILLVNSSTETKWSRVSASACSAFCHPSKRVAFIDPENPNKKPAPPQGSTLFYFGWRPDRFEDVFLQFGLVFRAHSVALRMAA